MAIAMSVTSLMGLVAFFNYSSETVLGPVADI
jgi:hypothetical protein